MRRAASTLGSDRKAVTVHGITVVTRRGGATMAARVPAASSGWRS